MAPRGGMRQYPPQSQQITTAGNQNAFTDANSPNNNSSNNQLLAASSMIQIPPQSHQGPSQHQGPPQVKMHTKIGRGNILQLNTPFQNLN